MPVVRTELAGRAWSCPQPLGRQAEEKAIASASRVTGPTLCSPKALALEWSMDGLTS